jgi:hypothetical protein
VGTPQLFNKLFRFDGQQPQQTNQTLLIKTSSFYKLSLPQDSALSAPRLETEKLASIPAS